MTLLKILALTLALSFGGAVALNADTPPAPVTLPALPDSIPSQLGWVKVHIVPGLLCNGQPAYGCFEPGSRTLSVADSLNRAMGWQTLEHERFHMILFDAGSSLPSSIEDHLADVVGAARVTERLAALAH